MKWFEAYGRAALNKAALKIELGVVDVIIVEWNEEVL